MKLMLKKKQLNLYFAEKKEIFILKIKLYRICHKQNFYFPYFVFTLISEKLFELGFALKIKTTFSSLKCSQNISRMLLFE